MTRPVSILYAVSFLVLISVPVIVNTIENLSGTSLDAENWENRSLAERPTIDHLSDWKTFTRAFDDYYQDSFGWRNRLLRIWLRVKWSLGESPTDRVLVGSDGWLYFTGDELIEDLEGRRLLTEDELRAEKQYLEAKRDWLRAEGIRYLYVVVPNKHTVYPEHLPASVQVSPRTRLDQFVDYMQAHSDVEILDLRDALLADKSVARLFQKTDTHWNMAGAQVAWQAIIENLRNGLPLDPVAPLGPASFETEIRKAGDLARLTGFGSDFTEEWFEPRQPAACEEAVSERIDRYKLTAGQRYEAFTCESGNDLELLYIGDSFRQQLLPLLRQSFARTDTVNIPFNPELVKDYLDTYRPHVLIEQSVERLIMKPAETETVNRYLFASRFDDLPLLARLDPADVDSIVTRTNRLTTETEDDRVAITTTSEHSYLMLSWEGMQDRIGLRARYYSPHDTVMRVFYRTRHVTRYNELAPKIIRIKAGWNDIHLVVAGDGVRPPLRLDPGVIPGRYVFDLLELRLDE